MKLFKTLFLCFLLSLFWGCQKENDFVENSVPVSDAGVSQSITLPVDSVVLSGNGNDADGHIVAYLWSQVAGPAPSLVRNPGAKSTIVKFTIPGTYLFQLMVTDNKGATGVDTSSVIVNPSLIKTVTISPANNPNEMNVTALNGQNQTVNGIPEISIDAWTSGGQPWILREYLKFDMSSIPQNATIISANLYLYSNPQPLTGNLVNANFGSSNSLLLQQVTSAWTPASIGWYSQPSVSTSNQIVIPHTNQSVLDLNIDVKNMVSSMISTNSNYGFGLRLENEVTYNSRIFVSSFNNTYPDKRPKLVVVYQ